MEAARISGTFEGKSLSDSQATKIKTALVESFEEELRETGRGAEVDFQNGTTAQQFFDLGMLPVSLARGMREGEQPGILSTANAYLAQAQAMRDAKVTGITALWREHYWPALQNLLASNPQANRDFSDLINLVYGETDHLTGMRKLFLGQFGPE